MRLFKKICDHQWKVYKKSNVLQLDEIGWPLRLCICECSKCGTYDQKWLIASLTDMDKLQTGELVLLEWEQ